MGRKSWWFAGILRGDDRSAGFMTLCSSADGKDPDEVERCERLRSAQRQNNLRQTLLAMLDCEAIYGSFPASANFDADGKPLLHWRVHILPFLAPNELHQ